MNDLTPRVPARPLIWSDDVLAMMERLSDLELPLYIVGGAVRDAYLHRPVKDIDLAVPGDAIAIARRITDFLDADIFIMDRERGVSRILTAAPEGPLVIDVARFRGDDLLADLRDRDFTLNAMAVDLRQLDRLIDPLGGEQDIAAKLLRRCHEKSIADDPIRALRAVRQSVQLNMRIEPQTLQDIRAHASELVDTSAERVRDEFFSLLSRPKPAMALRVADTLGLLTAIVPEIAPLHNLAQSAPHTLDVWNHTLKVIEKLEHIMAAISPSRTDNTAAVFDLGILTMQLDRFRKSLQMHLARKWPNERSHTGLLILTALLHNAGKAQTQAPEFPGYIDVSVALADQRADSLRLSSDEKKRLMAIIRHYRRFLTMDKSSGVLEKHRFWYELDDAGVDVCLFALADYLGTVGQYLQQDDWLVMVEKTVELLQVYYEQYNTIVRPPALVDGRDLMAYLNIQPGPVIGQLLDYIREAQVIQRITTREQALELAEDYLQEIEG